jgi:hypothetical protein
MSRINTKTSQTYIVILSSCSAWVDRQWLKRVVSPAWMQLLSCTPVRYTVGLAKTTGVSRGAAIAVGYDRTRCPSRSDNTIIDPHSMRLGPVQSSCVRWFTGMTRPLRMCQWHVCGASPSRPSRCCEIAEAIIGWSPTIRSRQSGKRGSHTSMPIKYRMAPASHPLVVPPTSLGSGWHRFEG